MTTGQTITVIGATMCTAHRSQVGVVVSDETQPNHAGEPMQLVDLQPERSTGLFAGRWWIEEDELTTADVSGTEAPR